jgi:hypothetical protein
MMYGSHDTDWSDSSAGNQWRRLNQFILIVGKHRKAAHYWASIDHAYLQTTFASAEAAKKAVELELERRQSAWERGLFHDA